MAEKLTDRTAKTSNFADGDLVHVVDVSDTSQDPAGSSFKSTIGNIYGSYLAPKITSSQIVTNAADTYSLTLADTVSSNHFLFLKTASGNPFVDVTVTSYSNPKDGAILVMTINEDGTDDLVIPGFIAASGFSAGVYTARYSTSAASWASVNYLPLTVSSVEDFTDLGDVPSTYSGQANKIVKVNAGETGLEFGEEGFFGENYILLSMSGTPIENRAELNAAYTGAGLLTLNATNRYTIVIPPCIIDGETLDFAINEPFVDIKSLTGKSDVYFINGTIVVTAVDIRLIGLNVGSQKFTLTTDNAANIYEFCTGGALSFAGGAGGSAALTASGTFVNCTAGSNSFGDLTGYASYCRITSGTNFPTVTGGGITRFCINGNNTADNQG